MNQTLIDSAELAELRKKAANAEMYGAAIDACRKVCEEVMGGNLAFVDDDVARCMVTLRDHRNELLEVLKWAFPFAQDRGEMDKSIYAEEVIKRISALAKVKKAINRATK